MFEERFARQYLYEPPPEFPLASPYTGIVHRLSGPNGHAITRIFHRGGIRIGRWCRLIEGLPTTARPIPCLRFHCAFQRASPSLAPRRVEERGLSGFGFFRHPARMHVRLLGPCSKTGRSKPLRQASRARRNGEAEASRPPGGGHALSRAPPRSEDEGGRSPRAVRTQGRNPAPPSRRPFPPVPTDADPPGRRMRSRPRNCSKREAAAGPPR